jgi:hypothetical protein
MQGGDAAHYQPFSIGRSSRRRLCMGSAYFYGA